VGWTTVARNAALAAVAMFIAWQAPASADAAAASAAAEPVGAGPLLTMLAWAAVALASLALFLAFQLLRQNGRLLVRIEAIEAKLGIVPGQNVPQGLPVDSAAPGFTAKDLHGAAITIDPVRDLAEPTLLVFIEPGCTACDTLLPDVARWQRENADRFKTMVISRGTIGQNRNKSAKHGIGTVLLQADRETAGAYKVSGVPSAVLIRDGKIASALASGADPIRGLAAEALRSRRGDLAPNVRLPDLRGQMTDVVAMRGRRTLLLFWNPSCGFCQRMLDDVKAWERQAPPGAPALLVISTGSAEDNAQQGFRSPVLLDTDFKTGALFGVSGTPSAVMLDEGGRIASEVGVGAEAVLALASSGLTPAAARSR
jgi:thiol-disulfide isomerase/thioredoxin